MLITKYLKAVILTTYLCSLSHMVQSRYMDQMLDRAHTKLSSASITTGTRQSSHISSPPAHHKHRHNHNLDNYNQTPPPLSSPLTLDLSSTDKKSSRDFVLYNRCSGHYLNFYHRSINANSSEDNKFSLMSLETQTYGTDKYGIRILSKEAGVYLCFNKRGKLITRYKGGNVQCLFTEIPLTTRYIKFRSVFNPDWHIGFNKNGRPMSEKIRTGPNKHVAREKCYHFVKKYQNISPSEDSSHEAYNNDDRNIRSHNLLAGPNVINTGDSYRSKNNEKSLHLMSPLSELFSSHEMATNSSGTIISHKQNRIDRQHFVPNKVNQQNDFKSHINVNYNHDYKINHKNNHNSEYHSSHHEPLR